MVREKGVPKPERLSGFLDFPDISVDVHYLISKLELQERRDGFEVEHSLELF